LGGGVRFKYRVDVVGVKISEVDKMGKNKENGKDGKVKEPKEPKKSAQPELQAVPRNPKGYKGDAQMVLVRIKNGKQAGRIFLLNKDGTFDRVVKDIEDYKALKGNAAVSSAKWGMRRENGGAFTQYLSEVAYVTMEQKDAVLTAAATAFKVVGIALRDGKLKSEKAPKVKAETTIIKLSLD
jgi:hypothetical protein